MRRTKIICTLGPATDNEAVLKKMIFEGMNVARLNFSHGSYEEHGKRIEMVKRLRKELGMPVGIMLDTKGPEIRIKTFKDERVTLEEGQKFILTTKDIEGTSERVSITYEGLPKDVSVGTRILIDDGLLEMVVEGVDGDDIVCIVKNSATISNRKSVNVPGIKLNMPYVSEKDRKDIIFAAQNGVEFIATSFARTAEDMHEVKKILVENGGSDIEIIAKIENFEGYQNLDNILDEVAGIMVARGDMGVEVDFDELPRLQKNMIKRCIASGKRVITATQMLESMINNPRPTRAEVSDVANAVYDGTSAIMLSGETSIGKYSVEAIKVMSKIATKSEHDIDYQKRLLARESETNTNIGGDKITNAISHATCTTSNDLGAKAIVAFTESGNTARAVSSFRPKTLIIGLTANERTYNRLSMSWGVLPMLARKPDNISHLYSDAIKAAIRFGNCQEDDLITITAGMPVGYISNTNNLRVHQVTKQDIINAAEE